MLRNIALVLMLCAVFCACRKDGNDHQTGNKLIAIEPGNSPNGSQPLSPPFAFLVYDEQERLDTLQTFNPNIRWEFAYDNTGNVVKIERYESPGITGIESYRYIIHYNLQGEPVSGLRTTYPGEYSYSHPSPFETYSTDSVSYQVSDGKVTEIKFFDNKNYNWFTRELVKFTADTSSRILITYSKDNISRITTFHGRFPSQQEEFTYGDKKGVLSSNLLKYFLDWGSPIVLYAENELLSKRIKSEDAIVEQETSYQYQYNKWGYPVSSNVTVTGRDAETYTQKYHYK